MKTLTKIAISNNKNNKTRSILVMIAIFLTTALLTIIATVVFGEIKFNKVNAAANYGSFYGVYQSVAPEQLLEMQRRSEFTDIGSLCYAGLIKSEDNVSLIAVDETVRQLTNMDKSLTGGHFPVQEKEIVAQPAFLASQGYQQAAIGDRVVLSYRADKTQVYEETEFVVSGLLADVEQSGLTKSYAVCCAPAFYQAHFAEDSRRIQAYFRLNEAAGLNSDNAETVLKELAAQCGISEKQVSVNKSYLRWLLNPGSETILVGLLIALCVIAFSVVVIYNIFQVGLVQKVQEYGKIKALGATNKQMRQLIFREGMLLTCISVPAGLLIGYIVANGVFAWLTAKSNELAIGYQTEVVSLFSLPVLLLSAALALLTVVLALRRPMRIVAKISPVEAMRYQDSSGSSQSGRRRGQKEVSVFSLALANIMGSPKRTLSTILTMGLSCVLFVILANYIGNIDVEYDARRQIAHGQFQLELAYDLSDTAYPENNLDAILKDNPLDQQLLAQIKALPAVTAVQTREIAAVKVNGKLQNLAVLSEEDFNNQRSDSDLGDTDYARGLQQNSIYYGWSYFLEDNGFSVGQPLTLELANGTASCTYQAALAGSFGGADARWVITEAAYDQLPLAGESPGWIWVDCRERDVAQVQQQLTELLAGKEHIDFTAYHDVLQISETSALMMRLGCYLFMAVIGLIGFMNLANTMIISIITKKQEYGILQAIGMTSAQLNKSLQLQGLIFTMGTVLVALGVGLPAGYGVFLYAKQKGLFGINTYHLPLMEIGLMVLVIAVLQLLLSFILSRNLKKETLVERIRYQG